MAAEALSARLAQVGLALADISELEGICRALESGHLRSDSTAPVRAVLAGGRPVVERLIQSLQQLWQLAPSTISGDTLVLALRASVAAANVCRRQLPATQVVWTGPKVEWSFLRSTREVIRELLRGACRDLLVIGYWIAALDDGDGIIEDIIVLLEDAVHRGVQVTIILDERQRADARDNHLIFVDAWPQGAPLPTMLTWKLPPNDKYLKLHAKVLVADAGDALVTSANLTSYAMDRNIEMGVRVKGPSAKAISDHFHRLISSGVLTARQSALVCKP